MFITVSTSGSSNHTPYQNKMSQPSGSVRGFFSIFGGRPGPAATRGHPPNASTDTRLVCINIHILQSEMSQYLLSFFLPPLGVFLSVGCGPDFWINV